MKEVVLPPETVVVATEGLAAPFAVPTDSQVVEVLPPIFKPKPQPNSPPKDIFGKIKYSAPMKARIPN